MSRTALKKEIMEMSHEQLVQIILDVYDARPEAKEYFEFFLNPDVGRLHEKCLKPVIKELHRERWGTSRMRVTILKRAIKDFAGYRPGVEAVLDFMARVLSLTGMCGRIHDLTETHYNYIELLTRQMLAYADSNAVADAALTQLEAIAHDSRLDREVRKTILDTLDDR